MKRDYDGGLLSSRNKEVPIYLWRWEGRRFYISLVKRGLRSGEVQYSLVLSFRGTKSTRLITLRISNECLPNHARSCMEKRKRI